MLDRFGVSIVSPLDLLVDEFGLLRSCVSTDEGDASWCDDLAVGLEGQQQADPACGKGQALQVLPP